MKVLNLIESMDLTQGGPPEVIRNLKKSLNKEKKIICVLSLRRITNQIFFKFLINYKARKKLFKFLSRYDVMHSHTIWSFKVLLLTYFANTLGIKVIFSSHGYLDDWSMTHSVLKKKLFYNFFLKKTLLRSNVFFSNIGEFKDSRSKFSFANKFVIPNGIDLSIYNKVNSKKNLTKKKIIYFGRIHEKKGIEILLKAIKELPKDFFERYFFEITGPGETNYINKINKLISNYKIESFVSMLLPKKGEDKINYLLNADVFVLPSYEEGDSIALKEAMSAENAVIISEQCRLNLVSEKNAGFIIKTDKDSLKNALLKLDKHDLQIMGKNSKNIIKEFFDNDYCSNRVLKIYEDIHTGSFFSKDWISSQ
tara:strand:- start:669 stop:1766 length:1098 start_codon:yes stop_codon:yes gene_type:complete